MRRDEKINFSPLSEHPGKSRRIGQWLLHYLYEGISQRCNSLDITNIS